MEGRAEAEMSRVYQHLTTIVDCNFSKYAFGAVDVIVRDVHEEKVYPIKVELPRPIFVHGKMIAEVARHIAKETKEAMDKICWNTLTEEQVYNYFIKF